MDDRLKRLAVLFGLDRVDKAESVATAQALLSNTHTAEAMNRHNRRMSAVQDAFWKSRCPEYEPPEDDVGSNFVNCSIVSDQAINQLAALVGDCPDNPANPEPKPPPTTRPNWWRVVFATLLAVALGALLVFVVAQYFLDVGEAPAQYEIIGTNEPFSFPEPFRGQ